jgi:putative membrane protein
MILDIVIRIVINAVAFWVTASILTGFRVADNDIGTYLVIGLIFGVVNAIIKPIVKFLTCPLTLLTLGLFIFVINGLMLLLTASLSGGRLQIDSFLTAIVGGIIMALVNVVLEAVIGAVRRD